MNRKSKNSLLLCVLIVIVAVLGDLPHAVLGSRPIPPPPNFNRISEQTPAACVNGCVITIAAPEELDFLSKAEVLARRRSAVSRNQDLLGAPYTPYAPIFEQITDGKPWWGLWGLYAFGAGEHGSDGPSEETRFLLNPFLLIGVLEQQFFPSGASPEDLPAHYYPTPTRLRIDPVRDYGEVSYDVHGFLKFLTRYYPKYAEEKLIHLSAYNARDAGFSNLAFSRSGSKNMGEDTLFDRPIPILHFIHTGGSCGRKEGCNNMSPSQKEFDLRIREFPATLAVKLWREAPPTPETDADFLFVLNFD